MPGKAGHAASRGAGQRAPLYRVRRERRPWLRLWLVLFAGLLLSACAPQRDPVRLEGSTMGTSWHVTYIPGHSPLASADVRAGIQAQLAAVEDSMSTYIGESEISRFNRQPVGEWLALSPDFVTVLRAALKVGQSSHGAYDVTVAPLVNRWGFGPDPLRGQPPSDEEVQALLQQVGQDKLELDAENARLRKRAPVSIDFSSIAKGYGVDRVAEYLLQQQIDDFMVEVGGEIRLSGVSPRGDLWRIAVEQPDPAGRSMATAVALTDRAVATSGDYRNFFELDGRRYSHSIDPRTGYPVLHDLVSVTVIHDSAMLADAWATALIVLGGEQARAVAEANGLAVYFIRRHGDEFIATHSSAYWVYANSVKLQQEPWES